MLPLNYCCLLASKLPSSPGVNFVRILLLFWSKFVQLCHIHFIVHAAGLRELSECSNVYAKVSGMFFTDPKWNQQSIEDVVKPVLEIFGIDR